MKALTVRNPWPWAIATGAKRTENREWHTTYRGPLAIHAGSRARWDPDGAASPLIRREWAAVMGPDVPLDRRTDLIPFSAIVAVVTLAGIHHASACKGACSEWAADGQFHWGLRDLLVLPEPVPCTGKLGLWAVPGDIESAVQAQLGGGHG